MGVMRIGGDPMQHVVEFNRRRPSHCKPPISQTSKELADIECDYCSFLGPELRCATVTQLCRTASYLSPPCAEVKRSQANLRKVEFFEHKHIYRSWHHPTRSWQRTHQLIASWSVHHRPRTKGESNSCGCSISTSIWKRTLLPFLGNQSLSGAGDFPFLQNPFPDAHPWPPAIEPRNPSIVFIVIYQGWERLECAGHINWNDSR